MDILKSKSKSAVKAINRTEENENLKKATCVEILRANNPPTRGLSKTVNTDHSNTSQTYSRNFIH